MKNRGEVMGLKKGDVVKDGISKEFSFPHVYPIQYTIRI